MEAAQTFIQKSLAGLTMHSCCQTPLFLLLLEQPRGYRVCSCRDRKRLTPHGTLKSWHGGCIFRPMMSTRSPGFLRPYVVSAAMRADARIERQSRFGVTVAVSATQIHAFWRQECS
jgi:hypothetical protein